MNNAYPNPSNVLPLFFKINRQARIIFTITVDDAAPITTGWTWQLFIKRFAGDRINIINLTLGNGLRYEIYSDTDLVADFSSAQTNIEEGEYYWELVRTDIERTWIEGIANFEFSKSTTETGTESSYTVNVDSTGSPVSVALTSAKTINITNSAVWGSVTGTLASQTDLVAALNLRQLIIITETALVDAATIDIAAQNNTLATSRSTITFTISSTATFNRIRLVLTGTSLVLTLPANSLGVNSDGTASGTNTCTLSGTSGDAYEIMTAKSGAAYTVIAKNIGQ